MLAIFVLLAGVISGLGINANENVPSLVVLTDDNGIITSPENVTDITYEIRAPAGKKIELTFDRFTFLPCQLSEQACLKNHHLIVIINSTQKILKRMNFKILIFHLYY